MQSQFRSYLILVALLLPLGKQVPNYGCWAQQEVINHSFKGTLINIMCFSLNHLFRYCVFLLLY